MNEFLLLAPALAAGLLLGALFFGALWWTVIRGLSSAHSGLWFFGSLLLRTGLTLAAFYWIGREHWERLVFCLIGFVLARLIVQHLTRPVGSRPHGRTAGALRAS